MAEKDIIPYRPGLEGVTAGISKISDVIAAENRLIYRGYDIRDLAANCSFEEVAYLILLGKLPNRRELSEFESQLKAHRELPAEVYATLKALPKGGNLMAALQVGVATLGMLDPKADDNSHDANLNKAIRLTACMPTLVANAYRILQGQEPVAPRNELGHAENFLYVLFGREPEPLHARVMNLTFILYAEHGYNASTFTAHVIASTLADMYSAVVGAIGALRGPLHGGANEAAMEAILEIGSPERAESWVMEKLAQKARIMGFGHREYKTGDIRAVILKDWVRQLAEQTGRTDLYEIQNIMERVMLREKNLHPNVDFPAATVYYMMGIPIPLYTPIFAAARIVGWTAHVIEQHDDNRLIRPRSDYAGPRDLVFKPIDERE
ncbi:MAG: citrate synthase [Fimbriimonadales bacterium]|jgi:citrate synthase|nr:citrate synthase [Armatimonadota bacterium]MCX7686777.1 citrate synthase [Fimbriimonadales bacterium]CUU05529.1 citrate synthase [Armatimonadetes bacterium GBS]CUU36157.1 citrate synthase [Armatimonadetes bacterium GXS]GBC90018.1 Citrate synthase 2 [bacterium HR14]